MIMQWRYVCGRNVLDHSGIPREYAWSLHGFCCKSCCMLELPLPCKPCERGVLLLPCVSYVNPGLCVRCTLGGMCWYEGSEMVLMNSYIWFWSIKNETYVVCNMKLRGSCCLCCYEDKHGDCGMMFHPWCYSCLKMSWSSNDKTSFWGRRPWKNTKDCPNGSQIIVTRRKAKKEKRAFCNPLYIHHLANHVPACSASSNNVQPMRTQRGSFIEASLHRWR